MKKKSSQYSMWLRGKAVDAFIVQVNVRAGSVCSRKEGLSHLYLQVDGRLVNISKMSSFYNSHAQAAFLKNPFTTAHFIILQLLYINLWEQKNTLSIYKHKHVFYIYCYVSFCQIQLFKMLYHPHHCFPWTTIIVCVLYSLQRQLQSVLSWGEGQISQECWWVGKYHYTCGGGQVVKFYGMYKGGLVVKYQCMHEGVEGG